MRDPWVSGSPDRARRDRAGEQPASVKRESWNVLACFNALYQ
jgi:hypothetical protein